MKTLSTALAAHVRQELTTLATLIKITRRDNVVLGFTSHDADLTVDGVTYAADNSFQASALESRARLSTDNLTIAGILSSAAVSGAALAAGAYDHARVDVYLCNWADLSQEVAQLRRGWLGEVTRDGGAFRAELRGLHDLLQRPVGARVTPECRHDLGSAACGVNLAALTVTGTVTSVSANWQVGDTSRGEADGHFDGGVLTFTSGANAGFAAEIRGYAGKVFTLWLSPPQAPAMEDAYSATPGCGKRLATCRDRYGNSINFGGFPHLPGLDAILNYPDS